MNKIIYNTIEALSDPNGLLITRSELNKMLCAVGTDGEEAEDYRSNCDKAFSLVKKSGFVSSYELMGGGAIPDGSVAYYRIDGPIVAEDNYWFFSSKEFLRQFEAAESNENIKAHFIHISSGGGQAWYLDRVADVMSSADKPIHVHIEGVCCSAAYYIAACADVITAETPFCTVGSIGVMCTLIDPSGLFDKMGIKLIELYATRSSEKNKKYRDAIDGKADAFIKEDLNPLAERFVSYVRKVREPLSRLEEDDKVFAGYDCSAEIGVEIGLVDEICPLSLALSKVESSANTEARVAQLRGEIMSLI